MSTGRATPAAATFLAPLLALALLLAGCAAPKPAAVAGATATGADVPRIGAGEAPRPDLSCRVAGDCAVRNVGNCCGYFPACVNRDSRVDPEAVRAECARTGTSSVCGWREIQACECADGSCRPVYRTVRIQG